MSDYGKVLKKYVSDKYVVSLFDVNELGENSSYSEWMKEKYDNGFTQVILNSHIMIRVIEQSLVNGWILSEIKVEDPSVDEDAQLSINRYIDEIKVKPMTFLKLKEYLSWALDDGSIFIDTTKLSKKIDNSMKICEMNSNGLLFGEAKTELFSQLIKKEIEEYLNEG